MKFTLDETFTYCESMWVWVKDQIKDKNPTNRLVNGLKEKWLEEHRFSRMENDCFFCEYAKKAANVRDICVDLTACRNHCPEKMIDPDFNCCNTEGYHYLMYPEQFADKIVEMNKSMFVIG